MRKLLLPLILFYLFNCCKDGDIIIEQSEEKIITVKVRDTIFIVDDSYEVIELNPIPLKKEITTPSFANYKPFYQSKDISGYWGGHWTWPHNNTDNIINGKRDIASYYYPLVGVYDSTNKNYVEYSMLMMKLSGFDGIIISYYGNTDLKYYNV
ncbi:MAG: hypothetical protein ISP72_07010 [Flavobacteriaceae bacterium]|nr:hypothetical protein [Flavobacteriaceae bacterium]